MTKNVLFIVGETPIARDYDGVKQQLIIWKEKEKKDETV